MAMAMALRKLSSSVQKPIRPLFTSNPLFYMSSLPNEAIYEKENSRVAWPKQLNSSLEVIDPEIANIIELEKARQWKGLEFIPSKNFTSVSVMQAVGSIMTNKYSEGYPGARYCGGNETIEIGADKFKIPDILFNPSLVQQLGNCIGPGITYLDRPQKHVLSDGKARALMAHQMQASCDQACQVHEHGATHSERKEEDSESAKASRRQLKETIYPVLFDMNVPVVCAINQVGTGNWIGQRSFKIREERRNLLY